MQAIERQNDHHDEVRDQQRYIERVPPILAMEVVNLRRVVRLPVVLQAVRGDKKGRNRLEKGVQVVAPVWV
jgi:hypothetical protein